MPPAFMYPRRCVSKPVNKKKIICKIRKKSLCLKRFKKNKKGCMIPKNYRRLFNCLMFYH